MNKLLLLPVGLLLVTCQDDIAVPAPVADFTSPDISVTGTKLAFTNLSTNAKSYKWSFGDGSTSNTDNAYHTYTTSGMYQVVLRAYNARGDSVKTAKTLSIITPSVAGRYRGYVQTFQWFSNTIASTGPKIPSEVTVSMTSPQSVSVLNVTLPYNSAAFYGWQGNNPNRSYYQYGDIPNLATFNAIKLQHEINGDSIFIMQTGGGGSSGSGSLYYLKKI